MASIDTKRQMITQPTGSTKALGNPIFEDIPPLIPVERRDVI
jgi:hypothetical protein